MNKNKNKTEFLVILILLSFISACSNTGSRDGAPKIKKIDIDGIPNAVPTNEPLSKYGNPSKYVVRGNTYYVKKTSKGYSEKGKASWYGTKFHGRRTSSGVPYDMFKMTAAHKTLPLPTYVEVKNLDNGKIIVVKVNDRGPFHGGRIIDLSYVAALKLDIIKSGTGNVQVRALSVAGEDNTPSYIQVAAFNDFENASRVKSKLIDLEIESEILTVVLNARKKIYRVRIGPIGKQSQVNDLLEHIKSIGIKDAKVFSN